MKVFLIIQSSESKRNTITIRRFGRFRFLYYGAGLSVEQLAAGFQLILKAEELDYAYKDYLKSSCPPAQSYNLLIS